ncbi:uncharacterized protein cubi_01367 [Cryptosporidium ubiquitum]|uniref:Uncharacterized protein n=1 Tax=Cryptosporidium ubiquitum TaxID=857276 RepID=A0A1J4MCS3_9CRYT|nr:uncharacterized protein cubi_01367 [Cryptosporidium ubiquitum]OII72034.1 hypothetical protein cubi_01367 [Cryptosporidium ubiquitum]
MAKKNNKNRKKRYIEWLKETEKNNGKKIELKTIKRQNIKCKTDDAINEPKNVCMSIKKVKKNIKLDKKGKRRLNKLSGIKMNNTPMNL